MVKIAKNNRITIPSEIMNLKGWSEGTELIFVPFNQDAKDTLERETPIVLNEVIRKERVK
ncbi:MAG: hypothetical protein KAS87_05355 [Candidatus Omnitrophica bacterium]|nr:hypothetical protein [Candidatus Omnitrophota bacterium]